MTKVISFFNHKGGVAKTTSAVNVAEGLHILGNRILLIDLDPQANLTLHLLDEVALLQKLVDEAALDKLEDDKELDKRVKNIYGALLSKYPLPILSLKDGLDIVISNVNLSSAEIQLINEPGREYLLRELIQPFLQDYDYILIDCPPSLGLLSIVALSASTHIIIPVESGAFSLKGMTVLFDVIEKVKHRINPNLQPHHILITKYDSRKSIQRQISTRIQQLENVFKTIIRMNVALEDAVMWKCSVFDVDKNSSGAQDYMNLCKEIINI